MLYRQPDNLLPEYGMCAHCLAALCSPQDMDSELALRLLQEL